MTTTTSQRQPELTGQTVVTGGGADIGLQAARRARAEGAGLILIGRTLDRLEQPAAGLGAVSRAALNTAGPAALERFPGGLPKQADRVMVMAAGPAVR